MSRPIGLSVVAPVYNEAAVVAELVARIRSACERTGLEWEIVIADDASTDATAEILARVADGEEVRHLRLPANAGQFGATREGLRVARGDRVIVLDGDLQDPPEQIALLVRAHDASSPRADVVFAVKARRSDPLWFRVGRAGYRALAWLGGGAPPSGSGSYCLMERELAARAAAVDLRHANLAPVLMALLAGRGRVETVPYAKEARRAGDTSRVGAWGLAQEALGSLRVSGALRRLGVAACVVLGVTLAVGLALSV